MYKDNGVDPIEIASEKMRQFIIELAKLEATPKRFLNDMFSVWIRFIRDPNSIPVEFLNIPEVKEAMETLTVMSADPETRAEYNARIKELNDIHAGQSVKYKEGLEKGEKIGIEKGKAEGAHDKAVETAKNALALGLSIEQASKISSLSVEEILKLA